MGEMGRWIEVTPPGAKTAFALLDAGRFQKADRIGDSAQVTLLCSDVRELYACLNKKGVPVTEPETQSWGTFIKITDPDGQEFVVSDE
jgi:predicted enzyme related to lactoylglutathione lyase